MKNMKNFTLNDIEIFAKNRGLEVNIDTITYWDWNLDKPADEKDFVVTVGQEWEETWEWTFENNLTGKAVDFTHCDDYEN